MKEKIKKLAVPFCIVLVILLCLVWIVLQGMFNEKGNIAQVRVSGEVVLELDLNRDTRQELHGDNGIDLVIVVDSGSVYVENSECPDKICVNKGRISDVGETIVCLPARTIVEVVDGGGQNKQ